jgi:uncharacterized membrane protein YgcG
MRKGFDLQRVIDAITAKQVFLAGNIALFILATVSFSLCQAATSLKDFFDSSEFRVQSAMDIIVNMLLGSTFFVQALRLKNKLSNFLKASSEHDELRNTVNKMFFVMAMCQCAFLLRIVMLVVKLHRSKEGHAPGDLITYSVGWFFLTDFIPRALPILAFGVLVGRRKSDKEEDGPELDDVDEAERARGTLSSNAYSERRTSAAEYSRNGGSKSSLSSVSRDGGGSGENGDSGGGDAVQNPMNDTRSTAGRRDSFEDFHDGEHDVED